MAALTVGDFRASPGTKVAGIQQITVAGHKLELPIFLINGAQPGPVLTVTAGVHGAEYASIEAVLRLGRSVQPQELTGQLIVMPVLNMPAFRTRTIYLFPPDGKNLNRVFPGKADGTASEQLAHWVFQNAIQQSDSYIDLHSGDMNEALVPLSWYYQSGDPAVDEKSAAMATAFGIYYVVRSRILGATYSAGAAAGIPSMTAEAIGQGLWPDEAVSILTRGLNRVMRLLKMLEGPPPEPMPVQVLDKLHWLLSEHDGFFYLDVAAGDIVTEGQPVGRVTDFEGNVLQEIVAPATGPVLFLVSSLAINKGDTLLAVGV